MKKYYFIVFIIILLIVLFQPFMPIPKVYSTCVGVIVFMYFMMRTSSKIPAKSEEEKTDDI